MTEHRERHYLAVVDYLKQGFVSGTLHAGTPLPPVSELSGRLRFGERSVADALNSLTTVGVLSLDGDAYQINPDMGMTTADLLCLMLLTNRFHYLDISHLRRMLEQAALPAILQNITEEIKNDLHTALLHMKASPCPNPSADSHFHRRMIAACGNPLFICIAEAVSQALELQITAVDQANLNITWHGIVEVHEKLFQCLCSRDLDAARAALEEHYNLLNRELSLQSL